MISPYLKYEAMIKTIIKGLLCVQRNQTFHPDQTGLRGGGGSQTGSSNQFQSSTFVQRRIRQLES